MKEIKDLQLKDMQKLQEMDEKNLRTELKNATKNLYVLTMKKQLGELKQTHLMTALKKYIAQVNTVASAKGIQL